MPKSKTYFPQVPVEVAKKIARAESHEAAAERLEGPKKNSSNGKAAGDPNLVDELSEL
jgi:hypothetical protein